MATKFIGKVLGKKVVRPMKNAVKYGRKNNSDDKKAVVADNKAVEETVTKETPKKEN